MFERFGIALSIGLAGVLSCAFLNSERAVRAGDEAKPAEQAPADHSPSAQLRRLFDEAWEYDLRDDPLHATYVGDRRFNDRLPSETLADYERRAAQTRIWLARLAEIDRAGLSSTERNHYDIFRWMQENTLSERDFLTHLTPITNRWGFHISFPELPRDVPLRTVDDYRNYIARLNAFAKYAEQHIELMREGIRRRLVLPEIVLVGYETPLEGQIHEHPEQSTFYRPFREWPDALPEGEREALREAGRAAIATSIFPGYRRFLEFMRTEYVPAARGEIGVSALPRGREFYRYRVRKFTTLDLTPEEVHALGLAEVARIRGEMDQAVKKAEFDGTVAEFVEYLRNEDKFYATTPEHLLKETALVLKRMDGRLPELFRKLPRLPYGIREVPAFIAPRTTTAYYSPPPGDGSRAGFYYVNTHDLRSRPLYEIQALSLHEAVPGHHLQIALQQELTDLPNFRRFGGVTAFVEGWGLYAERLGLEVGFYDDPYSEFGRLSYEMWRACRLVVDTGMHYHGWSRQQAIDYMAANTALSLLNIANEVDRYIAWPGQALAYKIGELKIRELRQRAESRLGRDFDVREFHDVVLRAGSVPLGVLEENVENWLESKPAAPSE